MRLLLWAAALLGGLALLRGAPAERPPFAHAPMGVANGCFVESVVLLDRWAGQGGESWRRLLQWGAREEEELVAGHAVAVGEHRGQLWCWDVNRGWAALPIEPARKEDAAAVAGPVLKHYPRTEARYPLFRHDFPQAEGKPPALPAGTVPAAVRDAVRAGGQLARMRPVTVVRFVHGSAEQPQESAAAVFLYHGRYCVYLPERGTVPFRLRGDLANLRLIQELLRRSLPGARELRRL